jgi:ABC-2 type transport system ATP-binding protein
MGQKAQLWWDLPALDCFRLLAQIYRIPETQFQANMKMLCKALDVEHVLRVQIRRLSLGERMKMELVAALLHDPKVIFLDEPTIGLDHAAQNAVRNFLQTYRTQHQPIVLLTSHYMEDIERLCKRVVILKNGQVCFDGLLDQIRDRFASKRLLKFRFSQNVPTESEFFAKVCPEEKNQCSFEVHEDTLHLLSPRSASSKIASLTMGAFSVQDFSLEEEDIGQIIERMTQGSK